MIRTRSARYTVLALAGLTLAGHATALQAQSVEGTVVDISTGEPVAGVELVLRNDRETVVARTESGEDGRFLLPALETGSHTLEASRLGYASRPPHPLELEREVLQVDLRISREPLELDPIHVTGQRHDPRHDLSFEGARVRRELLPDVGPRRVAFRSDHPFAAAMSVDDVLRWFAGSRSGCLILFRDGTLVHSSSEVREVWVGSSAEWWEAVEFYRRWYDAPEGLRQVPSYVRDPVNCSVVALWPRQDEGFRSRITWRRLLRVGGIAVVTYGLGSTLLRLLGSN